MFNKRSLLLQIILLAAIGNNFIVTTAQSLGSSFGGSTGTTTTLFFPPNLANICEANVDHDVFELGREVNVHIASFFDAQYGTMQIQFGADAGIYAGTSATGWCVDFDRYIGLHTYSVDTYSTYDSVSIPTNAVDKPQNLDLINWLVNEFELGMTVDPQTKGCRASVLTWKEIQTAIWKIIESRFIPSGFFGSKKCIVDYMVDQTMKHGEGFEPCCDNNQKIAAMLVIDSDNTGGATTGVITNQVIIAEMKINDVDGACPKQRIGATLTGPSAPIPTPGATGDPHFQTWTGEKYDFHGVCDLVLLQNPEYRDGLGMNIHIRTTQTRHWSYISRAVIRIGEDTLEVMGGKQKSFWLNGVAGNEASISAMISDHTVMIRNPNKKSYEYEIELGGGASVLFQTWNGMVRVDMKYPNEHSFSGSVGLLGLYPSGVKVGRDKTTIMNDDNDFGQEWQVLTSEPNLFHIMEDGPQAPEQCHIPTKMALRRRLSDSTISHESAEHACEHIKDKEEFDLCIFDVMATNNIDVAGAY